MLREVPTFLFCGYWKELYQRCSTVKKDSHLHIASALSDLPVVSRGPSGLLHGKRSRCTVPSATIDASLPWSMPMDGELQDQHRRVVQNSAQSTVPERILLYLSRTTRQCQDRGSMRNLTQGCCAANQANSKKLIPGPNVARSHHVSATTCFGRLSVSAVEPYAACKSQRYLRTKIMLSSVRKRFFSRRS
jgi:hypothetical protein